MKAKATLIAPENYDELIKAKHFLVSRNKSYKTINVPISPDESVPMIVTEMDILEKMVFKMLFRVRSEKMTVFG